MRLSMKVFCERDLYERDFINRPANYLVKEKFHKKRLLKIKQCLSVDSKY